MVISDELLQKIYNDPFTCTYSWVINWINQEAKNIAPGGVIVELGTFVGGTTRLLAINNPNLTIHSVELNVANPENIGMLNGISSAYNIKLELQDLVYIQQAHVADLPNVVLHTGDSKSLAISNVDLVFVDASHEEDKVLEDLHYAWNITKPNGYIFGDDVDSFNVYNALNRFAREKDIPYTIYSKVFKIQKVEGGSNLNRNATVEYYHAFTNKVAE